MIPVAGHFTICKGKGSSSISSMNAFDEALYDAGVHDSNLIKVSSVLPPDINKTDSFVEKVGAFRPCVMARAEGSKEHLMAGLCYGFREDGKGGYVAEYAATGDLLVRSEFEDDLRFRLESMGKMRGVEMVDITCEISELKVEEDAYGCAVVVLVYLP